MLRTLNSVPCSFTDLHLIISRHVSSHALSQRLLNVAVADPWGNDLHDFFCLIRGLSSDASFCWCSNYGVDFLRNTIVNVRQSPFVVTSAAQITIQDTSFVNVLCHGNDTQYFQWAPPGSLVALVNVDGVSVKGTRIHNNEQCLSPSGNYAQPVSVVNATHTQGMQPPDSASATILQGDDFT